MISIRLESFRDFIDQYGPRISEEGVFLVTDTPPARGETVEFEVGLADDFRLLHGSGEVVWTVQAGQAPEHPPGAAVRFLETDESSRRLITRIVHQQRERGEPVFDVGAAPGPEAVPSGRPEDPFGTLPEPEVGLFDGLQFDLVEQGGFGPPASPGAAASGGPEAEVPPALLEPDLPDAALGIELPGRGPGTPAVEGEAATTPPAPLEHPAPPPPVEETVTEELPEWMRPIAEPSGPEELLEMPDLSALGAGAPAAPPRPETEPAPPAAGLPSLEKELLAVEPAAPVPPPSPVQLPGPAARPEPEAPRRRSRWGWIAAGVGAIAVAALGVGAYVEGDAVKAWLGLGPAEGGAVTAAAPAPEAPAPAPAVAPEPEPAPPAAPAEPVAAAPGPAATTVEAPRPAPTGAAFRNVEDVSWREEPGRTVIIVATDGTVSRDRVEVESVDGGNPRLLIKLVGVERPLEPSTVPVGTQQVRQIRAGFHERPGGSELHLVADLTGPSVRQTGVDFRGAQVRITLSGG